MNTRATVQLGKPIKPAATHPEPTSLPHRSTPPFGAPPLPTSAPTARPRTARLASATMLTLWIALRCALPVSAETANASDENWALKPIQRPTPPAITDTRWPLTDIDRFILARLEAAGITPTPDADPYRLLRRLTFDLTGLPPTPEEIEAFVGDSSEMAYERRVDQLLASPGFGDHWARHWFDLSCYADLADISGNMLIRDAWRYRDYVIDAFNADKPLDRFIHEQIAGDLLPYDTVEQQREQIVATGYLAIGPWTLQNYIKGQMDADVVDHQIDRVGRTFLGMTLSCARCHDHKFDPVPTADYYALAGIFQSTETTRYDGPGVWSQIVHRSLPLSEREQAKRAARRDEVKRQLTELSQHRGRLEADLRPLLAGISGASTANALTLEQGIAANTKDTAYNVTFDAGPSVWNGLSQKTGADDGLLLEILRADGSVLASHVHRPGAWPGGSEAQSMGRSEFPYTGDGSGEVRIRVGCSSPNNGRFGGAIDNVRIVSSGRVVFSESFNTYHTSSAPGAQADTGLPVFAFGQVPKWTGAGVNHSHAVALREGDFAIQFFGGNSVPLATLTASNDEERQRLTKAKELEAELNALSGKLQSLEQQLDENPQALAVQDVPSPADGSILRRGDWQFPGERVPRGFLSAIQAREDHSIPAGQSGRRQLAEWLTDPDNPLTSRVLINRVWHQLFGSGLVRTVDYFGVHGEKPSHPQLLDFLARRLMEDGWSLKRAVRRMVLSRTYRIAATHDDAAWEKDPENRLRWRMDRRRLPAESIRDAMLAASGQLDPGRGGPSLGLELPGNISGLGGTVNPPTWAGKIPDTVLHRRSIYLPLKRERPGGELEILSVFDFPHPSAIVGARPETTVATQALFLMNSPFVKEQAAKLAARLLREQSDDRDRVRRLHLLAVSLPATSDEIDDALSFLDDCESELQQLATPPADVRLQAWTQLAHAVLASNSFLFRE